ATDREVCRRQRELEQLPLSANNNRIACARREAAAVIDNLRIITRSLAVDRDELVSHPERRRRPFLIYFGDLRLRRRPAVITSAGSRQIKPGRISVDAQMPEHQGEENRAQPPALPHCHCASNYERRC